MPTKQMKSVLMCFVLSETHNTITYQNIKIKFQESLRLREKKSLFMSYNWWPHKYLQVFKSLFEL